ncbi:unnamed protein product [Symbiodinium sp. CCMP2592]|nr:unnamed protein product [Symbiodinium sp. CCMP2592]
MAPKTGRTSGAKKAAKATAKAKAEATAAEAAEVESGDFAMETGREAVKEALDFLKKKKLFPAKAEKVGTHSILPDAWQGSSLKEASTFSASLKDVSVETLEVPPPEVLSEAAEYWFEGRSDQTSLFVSATVTSDETKSGEIVLSPEDHTKVAALVWAFGKAAASSDSDLCEKYRRLSSRIVISMVRGKASDQAGTVVSLIQASEDIGKKAMECSNAMPFNLASRLTRIRAALSAQHKASTHEEVFLLLKNIRWNGEAYKVKTSDQVQKLTTMLDKTNAAGMTESMKEMREDSSLKDHLGVSLSTNTHMRDLNRDQAMQATGMLHLRFVVLERLSHLPIPDDALDKKTAMDFQKSLQRCLNPKEWAQQGGLVSVAAFSEPPYCSLSKRIAGMLRGDDDELFSTAVTSGQKEEFGPILELLTRYSDEWKMKLGRLKPEPPLETKPSRELLPETDPTTDTSGTGTTRTAEQLREVQLKRAVEEEMAFYIHFYQSDIRNPSAAWADALKQHQLLQKAEPVLFIFDSSLVAENGGYSRVHNVYQRPAVFERGLYDNCFRVFEAASKDEDRWLTFDSGVQKASNTILKSFRNHGSTPQSIILIGSEESVQGRKDYLRSAWLGRMFLCLTAVSFFGLAACSCVDCSSCFQPREERNCKRRKTGTAGSLISIAGARETMYFGCKSDPLPAKEHKWLATDGVVSTACPVSVLPNVPLPSPESLIRVTVSQKKEVIPLVCGKGVTDNGGQVAPAEHVEDTDTVPLVHFERSCWLCRKFESIVWVYRMLLHTVSPIACVVNFSPGSGCLSVVAAEQRVPCINVVRTPEQRMMLQSIIRQELAGRVKNANDQRFYRVPEPQRAEPEMPPVSTAVASPAVPVPPPATTTVPPPQTTTVPPPEKTTDVSSPSGESDSSSGEDVEK